MKTKYKNISGWFLASIAAALMLASAIDKIRGSDHAIEMARSFNISPDIYWTLGIIELLSALLFIVPRTGLIGLLLLSSYMGGAIATHLQHGQDIIFPAAIEALIWITALIRYPELLIIGKQK